MGSLHGLLILLLSIGCNSATLHPARIARENPIYLSNPSNTSSPIALLIPQASDAAISASAFASNATFQTLVTAQNVSNTFGPICQADFGTGLDLLSCFSAISGFMGLQGHVTFGIRGQGQEIQIPRRFSSCKSI